MVRAALVSVLAQELHARSRELGLTVREISPREVRRIVVGNPYAKKLEVAQALAGRFPDLRPRLPTGARTGCSATGRGTSTGSISSMRSRLRWPSTAQSDPRRINAFSTAEVFMDEVLARLLESLGLPSTELPEQIPWEEIAHKQVAKDQLRRFQRYTEIQNDLIASGKSLTAAKTFAEACSRFRRLVGHAESLWDDACLLFRGKRYPSALAFSITTMEETGKIAVARFQLIMEEAHRRGPRTPKAASTQHRAHPFYSHTQKHILAAGAGALVNARLDRILGLEAVVAFLDRVEQGEIEPLRQACLYSESRDGELLLPSERIARDEAKFHVTLAGEILAEVAGFVRRSGRGSSPV